MRCINKFLLFFINLLISPSLAPGLAHAASWSELNAEYESLSRLEGELLDQIDQIQRTLNNPNMVFLSDGRGGAHAIHRDALAKIAQGALDAAQVIGLDQAYLETLPFLDRLAMEALIRSDLAIPSAVKFLARDDQNLRRAERKKIAVLEEMLRDVQARAAGVLAARDASLAPPQPASTADGPASNPVCLDDSVPVDYLASFHKIGYGAAYGFPVKGVYICRAPLAFQYFGAGRVVWYHCNPENPHDCTPEESGGLAFTRESDDDGNPVLRTEDGGSVVLHPPA